MRTYRLRPLPSTIIIVRRALPLLRKPKQHKMAFLNFLLAEALAAGLRRAEAEEAQQSDSPPPPNFFVLPRDPLAWCKFHEACRKENMVIAVEVTDNSKPNCKKVQPLFVREARKFESIPFVRVEIEFGLTYKQVSIYSYCAMFCGDIMTYTPRVSAS